MNTTLTTTNRTWGFFGTIQRNLGLSDTRAAEAYATAAALLRNTFRVSPETAIAYLDSVSGRHLADQIDDLAHAATRLESTLKKWRRAITRELGAIEDEAAVQPAPLAALLRSASPERHSEIRTAYYQASEGLRALREALQRADKEQGGSTAYGIEGRIAAKAAAILDASELGRLT